ncbi:Neutral and basic amino acid transport protein rBAT [Taenia crassiceps]|uniref:Neutral and basic amino acid transport protein rBAT n=1 Tax=Taenia crassiceps TaxID=6207 RepID=A0ABR4QCJ2_9CEST
MADGDMTVGNSANAEDVAFIEKYKEVKEQSKDECPLLTKEDLLRLDSEQPVWRRVRIALIALFWAVWICLIVVSILYIVFTPKCPPRPVQSFWQSKVGYWVNPFSFKDSDGDMIGDLKGLLSAGEYIQETVGAGFVILASMSPLHLKKKKYSGIKVSYEDINPALGTMEDFSALLRGFKKRGMQTVISLNFNAVPLNHEFAHPAYLVPATAADKFCRASNDSAELVNGEKFYSTHGKGSGVVDLNLKLPEVMEKVKNVTRFWLHKGVDGILLSDAAFFVEEGVCASDAWLSSFPTCKLYTNGTVSVIQELRKVVDEVSSETSRPRVLIADPGNTGYGASEKEDAEKLLGVEEAPGAHLVIIRQFAFNRGFYGEEAGVAKMQSYLNSTDASVRSQLALVVASPSDRPYKSVYSTASVFLLPGTPVIYAGTEIGWSLPGVPPPLLLYPFGEVSVMDDLRSHLPMPWDSRGEGFSKSPKVLKAYEAYCASLGAMETVETSLAAGRGASMFSLTTSLVQLHKEYPSLLWGSLNATMNMTRAQNVEVFKRSATGFDSVVVVIVEAGERIWCWTFRRIAHPWFRVQLSSLKVYFESTKECSLYVFKCGA